MEIQELGPIKLKVECIAATDMDEDGTSFVYVGTSDGFLQRYVIERHSEQPTCTLMHEHPYRKPITQIVPIIMANQFNRTVSCSKGPPMTMEAISDSFRIWVVVDGLVSLHDGITMEPIQVLGQQKGVNMIATNFYDKKNLVVLNMKKKLCIYQHTDTSCTPLTSSVNNLETVPDAVLPDTPTSIVWDRSGHMMAISMKNHEYCLVDHRDASITPVMSFNGNHCIKFVAGELFVLNKRVGSWIMMGAELGLVKKSSVSMFSADPQVVCWCYPYIVAFLHYGIEIAPVNDRKNVQQLPHKKPVKGWLYAETKECIYIYQNNSLQVLAPKSYLKFIDGLLEDGFADDAFTTFELMYTGSCAEKQTLLLEMKQKAGFGRFGQGDFEGAFEFWKGLVETDDVKEVIALYKHLLQPGVQYKSKYGHFISPTWSSKLTPAKQEQSERLLVQYLKDRCNRILDDQSHSMLDWALLSIYIRNCISKASEVDLDILSPQFVFRVNNRLDEVLACNILEGKGFGVSADVLRASKAISQKNSQKLRQAVENLKNHDAKLHLIWVLKMCEDEEVIFEYAPWALVDEPDHAIQIFTAKRVIPLPPDKVVAMLRDCPEEDLIVTYLEHAINDLKVDSVEHNTELGIMYVKHIQLLRPIARPPHPCLDFIGAGKEAGLLGCLRKKLLAFLETNDHYNRDILIFYLNRAELFEELVTVYSRCHEYEMALQVMVFNLQALEEAKEYCIERYGKLEELRAKEGAKRKGSPTHPPVEAEEEAAPQKFSLAAGAIKQRNLRSISQYITPESVNLSGTKQKWADMTDDCNPFLIVLLKLCLYPMEPFPRQVDFAVKVLIEHSEEIEPFAALKLIPGDILTISQLHPYLAGLNRRLLHKKRLLMLQQNLANMHEMKMNVELNKVQGKFVVLEQDTLCDLCSKRINEGTAFAQLPSGTLVHMRCLKDRHTDPVTTRDFRQLSYFDWIEKKGKKKPKIQHDVHAQWEER